MDLYNSISVMPTLKITLPHNTMNLESKEYNNYFNKYKYNRKDS